MFHYYRLFVLCIVLIPVMACSGAPGKITKLPNPEAHALPSDESVSGKPDYLVGVGDILLISVWKDESLTRQVTVLPDGTISFPLIGQLQVNGLTINALRDQIKARLSRYMPETTLSIQVLQANSQVVYVIGKVNRPGQFGLTSNMNILQALAVAGGLNPFAKSKKIKLFRSTTRETLIFPFNYNEVADGEHIEQNIRLIRGDVIVVP